MNKVDVLEAYLSNTTKFTILYHTGVQATKRWTTITNLLDKIMTSPYINHPLIDRLDMVMCGALTFSFYENFIKETGFVPANIVKGHTENTKVFITHVAASYPRGKAGVLREYIMWNMGMRLKSHNTPRTTELTQDNCAKLELFGATVDAAFREVNKHRRPEIITSVARDIKKVEILEAFLPREVGMLVMSF